MSGVALLLALGAAVAHASWNIIAHGSSRSGIPFLWWGATVSTVLWVAVVPLTGGLFLGQGANDGTDAGGAAPGGFLLGGLPLGGLPLGGFLLGVAVSAVLHVGYMLVLQRGYAAGDLSTVYATARGTGPLLTVLVAVTLLGEHLSPLAVVGVVAVIAGVVAIGFVDRTPGTGRRGPDRAVVFGLITGAAIAAYTVWDAFALRQWELAPVAFMVGCTALEVPLFTLLLLRRRRPRVALAALGAVWRQQWRRLVAFGILSPLSYILVLTAITIAPVALVAPVREVSVVLVSLSGAFVLREARPGRRVAASVVVAGGILLLAL